MTDLLLGNVTFHPISLFTESSKPLNAEHRLVVIRFKEKKGSTEKKPPSYCTSIPTLSVECSDDLLNKLCTAAVQEAQDNIIRDKVESFLETPSIKKEVNSTEISVPAISAFYDRVATSGRLSKESISVWFDESLAEELAIALLTAVPALNNDEEKLAAAIKGHKDHICNLASPRANMPVKLATQLKKAVLLAKDEDGKIKPSLLTKLEVFINPPSVDELALSL